MRSMTPNDDGSLIHSPKTGNIKTAKDVLKHRKALSHAPADVQIAAAWLLMNDTEWNPLLACFVAESLEAAECRKRAEDGEKPKLPKLKATKRLDKTMNFVLRALTERMDEMQKEKENDSPYRNN